MDPDFKDLIVFERFGEWAQAWLKREMPGKMKRMKHKRLSLSCSRSKFQSGGEQSSPKWAKVEGEARNKVLAEGQNVCSTCRLRAWAPRRATNGLREQPPALTGALIQAIPQHPEHLSTWSWPTLENGFMQENLNLQGPEHRAGEENKIWTSSNAKSEFKVKATVNQQEKWTHKA